MPSVSQVTSTVAARAVKRREAEKQARFRRLLAISMMSALTLGAVMLAKAETWVTVNPDGSVTKTEAKAQASHQPDEREAARRNTRNAETLRAYDRYPQGYNGYETPVSGGAVNGNTTFHAGTYYPIPGYSYSYPTPGGYTYPVGPVVPNVTPPLVTTLPGTVRGYGYGYPAYPAYPPYGYYPQVPVYSYPGYPVYGGTGIYYSGPAGGGGTVYSNSNTTGNSFGLSYGKGGLRIGAGHTNSSTNSTTTITTYGGR